MRKPLFIGLLAAALGVWSWALWRTGLFQADRGGTQGRGQSEVKSERLDLSLGIDPFRGPWIPPDRSTAEPVARKMHPAKPPVAEVPIGPLPRFNGCLGGKPPMAILEMDGRTEMVHAGSVVFGWTVTAVSAMGVDLERDGRRRHLAP